MSDLLRKLRDELQEVTRAASLRAAAASFTRIDDPRGGEMLTCLIPSEEQRHGARADQERFARWIRTVAAVLRRHGASADTERLTRMAADMSVYVLLERQHVADVREGEWRRSFERELWRASLALESVLDRAAASLDIGEQRRPVELTPFNVRVVQVEPGRWIVETADASEMVSAGDIPYIVPVNANVEQVVRLGQALFRAIFIRSVLESYVRVRDAVAEAKGALRIQLDVRRAGSLCSVPWELLHDGRQFVALSRGSAVARLLGDGQEPLATTPVPPTKPLRILLTISAPRSLEWLDAERERQRIEAAVAPLVMTDLVELEVAPDGSMNTLRRILTAAHDSGRHYHAWHFIGHGKFDEDAGRGALALTTAGGEPHYVGGWELGALFTDHPELRFVFLNACEGARSAGADAMSGVATALVQAGVTSVVAMQYPITDVAATIFAEEVYGALADGATLDQAVVEGRRGIFFRPNPTEWLTPVVFLHAREGGTNPFPQAGKTQR